MKSVDIENKKKLRIRIIEDTLNSFGFYKNEKQFEEMLAGEVSIVDYTKHNEIITVDFFPRENGRTVFTTKNMKLIDECKYINALSANFSLMV